MSKWFSVGDSKSFCCSSCNGRVEITEGGLDHHSTRCPICNIECVIIEWNKWIQVVTKKAPPQFQSFILWAQNNLDELEFVELLCNLEEIGEELSATK